MINIKSVFMSLDGGTLSIVQDGEVLGMFPVPSGRVNASDYWDLLPHGAEFQTDDLAVINPRSSYGVQSYGRGSHDSGANPDYRPTSASRMEMQMRVAVSKLTETASRLEARERALASIERMPTAPTSTQEDVQLVEQEPVKSDVINVTDEQAADGKSA